VLGLPESPYDGLTLMFCLKNDLTRITGRPSAKEHRYEAHNALAMLAITALLLGLGAGVVLVATTTCTGGDCLGTREADQITGSTSRDRIAGMEADDTITEPGSSGDSDQIFGDEGNDIITDNFSGTDTDFDVIYGDEGNDTIDVDELGTDESAGADTVDCGPGKKDKVFADSNDTLTHCEIKKINQPH
jgi:Ca2+-binding RTX toxin-like protein